MRLTHTAAIFAGVLFAAVLALTTGPARAQSATFNFDDLALGTKTTFAQNHSGLSVQFVSQSSPFVVGSAATAPLFSGQSLGVGSGNNVLEVIFFQPIYKVSVNFAAAGLSTQPDSVVLLSFGSLGPAGPGGPSDTEAGSVYASVPLGASSFNLVDGTLNLNSATPLGGVFLFDTNQSGFSLDNLQISASPVPEASTTASFGLLALGLGGMAWAARKRRVRA